MSDLHTIVGSGPLGSAVARNLLARGLSVRVISRAGTSPVVDVDIRSADATDPSALSSALAGSSVVYQCSQPEYHRWAQEFPALQAGILTATAKAGADLVLADNLYAYGRPSGPITETSPENPHTVKGRVRKQMADVALDAHRAGRLRVAISRPSNYFGPGYDQSGKMMFARALAGKAIQGLGSPDQPHSMSYVPDAGAAMAALGTGSDGWGKVWIAPVQPPITQREFAQRIWDGAGQRGPARIQFLGRRAIGVIGLFSPTIRAVGEMMYEFDEPFVADSSKIERELGVAPTPLDDAIAATLDAYRS